MKFCFEILIIGIFIFTSCATENKGRFFTKEEFENDLDQSVNNDVLDRIKSDSTIAKDEVVFSFYYVTDERIKIDLLIDYFKLKEKNQQIIELNQINQIWELNGRSYPIKLEIDSVNKWERKMWEIGYIFDCELDVWERTYEK